MLRFCCKELIFHRSRASTIPTRLLFSVLAKPLNSSSDSENPSSLTVSYLINSCGFSPESAVSASKKINIRSTKKSDLVIELFREHGFTDTQIRDFITKRPRVLLSRPETIQPRFEFFKSLKISNCELWSLLWREPLILIRSLKKMVISVDFVRSLVHTEGNVLVVIKQLYRYLQCDLERKMGPNISILRAHGVPELIIAKLLMIQATALMLNVDRFEASVVAAKKLGFKPTSVGFILAVRSMVVVSKLSWDRKMKTYQRTGWSEDQIFAAFKVQPMMILPSDEKIRKLMDFFTDKLGWEPAFIAKCPNLLLLSLEKRIIPRCSVLEVLTSKGLLDKDRYVPQVMKLNVKSFMEKFVIKYRDMVPEVEKAHQGEIQFHGFSCECKDGMLKVGVKSTSVLQNVVS